MQPFRIEPSRGQLMEDSIEASSWKAERRDIFNEKSGALHFASKACELKPESAAVSPADALPFAGGADVLAGESAHKPVDTPAEIASIQVLNVADPNRRALQGLVFHPRQECGRSKAFPLDVPHAAVRHAKPFKDESESEVESAEAGEESKGSDGMIHTFAPGYLTFEACFSAASPFLMALSQ